MALGNYANTAQSNVGKTISPLEAKITNTVAKKEVETKEIIETEAAVGEKIKEVENVEASFSVPVQLENKTKRKQGRPRNYDEISDKKTIHTATYIPEDYYERLRMIVRKSDKKSISEYIASLLIEHLDNI